MTRSAETGSFTLPASTGQINCIGARVVNNALVAPAAGHPRVACLDATGADDFDCFERVDVDTIGIDATLSGAARSAFGAGLAWKATAATGNVIACEATDSTNFNRYENGTSFSAAVAAYTAPTWASAALELGMANGTPGFQPDGIVSRLKADPASTRCR